MPTSGLTSLTKASAWHMSAIRHVFGGAVSFNSGP